MIKNNSYLNNCPFFAPFLLGFPYGAPYTPPFFSVDGLFFCEFPLGTLPILLVPFLPNLMQPAPWRSLCPFLPWYSPFFKFYVLLGYDRLPNPPSLLLSRRQTLGLAALPVSCMDTYYLLVIYCVFSCLCIL